MRAWILVLSWMCIWSINSSAQEMTASDSTVLFTSSEIWNQQTYASGTHLVTNPYAKIGTVSLAYQQENGSFRKSQEAIDLRQLNMNTYGQTILKRWHLSGAFQFQKYWLDSMNNTMRVNDDHFIPYYYFATKHGKYEQQVYDFKTQIFYAIIPSKLWLGTAIGLDYTWTTRSVDPRPNIADFKIHFKPEIVGQLGKHHLGLSYLMGYGDEKTNIRFKNTTFTQSLAYPDRIHYINQGFGFITLKDTTTLFNAKTQNSLGAHYNFISRKFKTLWNVDYSWNDYQFSMNEDRNNTYVKYNFEEKITTINGLAVLQQTNNWKHTLSINYSNRQGTDWNRNFKAGSYKGLQEFWEAKYILNWTTPRQITLELTPSVAQQYEYRKDAAASHKMEYAQLYFGINAGIYLATKGIKHHLNIGIVAMQPQYVNIAVPSTQENVFTENIFYPDYYYFSNSTQTYSIAYQFIGRQMKNNTALRFFAKGSWLNATPGLETLDKKTASRPSGSRYQIEIGLGLNI